MLFRLGGERQGYGFNILNAPHPEELFSCALRSPALIFRHGSRSLAHRQSHFCPQKRRHTCR